MKKFTSAMLSLLIVAAVVCTGVPAKAAGTKTLAYDSDADEFIYVVNGIPDNTKPAPGDYTGSYTANGTTLTLHDFAFETSAATAFLLPGENMTIILDGDCSIKSTQTGVAAASFGLQIFNYDLTIKGDGSLTLESGSTSAGQTSTGLAVGGSLIIESGVTVNAKAAQQAGGNAYGAVVGALNMTGGELNCRASSSSSEVGALDIGAGASSSITNAKVTAEATGASVLKWAIKPGGNAIPGVTVKGSSTGAKTGLVDLIKVLSGGVYGIDSGASGIWATYAEIGGEEEDGGGSAPVEDDEDEAEEEPKPMSDTTPPIVPVIYDINKTGDTFSFKVIVANANGNLAGAQVPVSINEKYKTTVTIGEDGVGFGTIDAPGFTSGEAAFSARVNGVSKGGNVTTPMVVFSDGRVVRR